MVLQEFTGAPPGTSMSRKTINGNLHELPPNKGMATRDFQFSETKLWVTTLNKQPRRPEVLPSERRIQNGWKRREIMSIHCNTRLSCSSRDCNLSH